MIAMDHTCFSGLVNVYGLRASDSWLRQRLVNGEKVYHGWRADALHVARRCTGHTLPWLPLNTVDTTYMYCGSC